jgi:large subunit ribosomal protein L30e
MAQTEDIDEEKVEATNDAQETSVETSEASAVEGEEEPTKKKKTKKVVRRRKSKKEKEHPISAAIRLAVESGKVEFGARTGIMAGIMGNAKLFVMATNTPADTRTKVEGYAKSSSIPIVDFDGSTMDLGSVCGKPFPVSVLSVFEAGSSPIMELAKKK